GAGTPGRVVQGWALDDLGRGRADDADRRPGPVHRARARRVRDRHARECARQRTGLGHRRPGRRVRALRADVPPGHHGLAELAAQAAAVARRGRGFDPVARRAFCVTIELMAIRRGVKIMVAVTLGVAALILNPWFGVTGGFDYGPAEMRAAIEGTWRLTLTSNGKPRREITVRIAQGAAASEGH